MKATMRSLLGERLFYDCGEQEELLFCEFDLETLTDEEFNSFLVPKRVTDGAVFICLQGEVEFFLDLNNYKLRKGDMCIAFPFSSLQTVAKSHDFKGYLLGVSHDMVKEIQLPSATDYYLYIKDNPCVALSDDEQAMLLDHCALMTSKYSATDHPFRQEIAKSLFKVIYFEIAAIYKKGRPIAQESIQIKDMHVRRFMYLLDGNFHMHRDVEYYAGEMCITPRHLSAVVKEKTGQSASRWISNMVVNQAKVMLKDSSLSIAQISDRLNFTTQSFFGKYFKNYTGISPRKYREMEF